MRPRRIFVILTVVLSFALQTAPATPASASSTPFTVHWTTPGDDGNVGRATRYDMRYSLAPLSAANFGQALQLTGLPVPGIAGASDSLSVTGLTDGVLYYLAIKSVDEVGNWSGMSNVCTRPAQALAVGPSAIPLAFSPPWPNPARDQVHWSYSLPSAARVEVEVFDVTGRHVRTVASADRAAGTGELSWDLHGDRGERVGSGVYFVHARIGSATWTKRLTVL